MNTQKHTHTPGPWSFDGPLHSIIVWGAEPEQRVCFMTSDGPAEANARLIAAAPEALEFAKNALASGLLDDVLSDAARAFIRKAEGGAS